MADVTFVGICTSFSVHLQYSARMQKQVCACDSRVAHTSQCAHVVARLLLRWSNTDVNVSVFEPLASSSGLPEFREKEPDPERAPV